MKNNIKPFVQSLMVAACLTVLLCCTGFSQKISSALCKKHTSGVIDKICDINEQMQYSLTDSSQSWLADAFAKQENLVSSFMQKNNDVKAICAYSDSIYWTIVEIEFPKIITRKERSFFEKMEDNWEEPPPVLNGVIVADMEMNSLFGIALWNYSRSKFILDQEQITRFTRLAKEVKSRMNKTAIDPGACPFDKDYFETVNAIINLGSRAYGELIALKSRKLMRVQAFNEWASLKEAGYAEKFNRDQTIKEIIAYHHSQTVQQALLDYMVLSKENLYVKDSLFPNLMLYTQKVYDSVADSKKRLDKDMPEALAILTEIKNRSPQRIIQRAKLLAGANRTGYLGSALFLCDGLHLKDAQVDSLTFAAIRLQNNNLTGDQMSEFESDQLNQILSEAEYRSVVHSKMYKECSVFAQQAWNELVQRKLTDESMAEDKTKRTISFFYGERYFIGSRFASQPEERGRLFAELEKKRPYALSLLIEARRASKGNNKSGYTW